MLRGMKVVMARMKFAVESTRISADGAELHIEVRGEGPALLLVGCPMDASAFAPFADELAADHMVITTDSRGINRSTVLDRDLDVTPEILASDYRQILTHLGVEKVSLFGSSGGAVAALAFTQAFPELVDTVIAHEPPLEELLDESKQLRANTQDMVETYLAGDVAGAWIKFFDGANISMPPTEVVAWIDSRTDEQELADEAFFFAHTMRPTTWWLPDVAALRAVASLIVIGVGAESTGQICDRTATAMATLLGIVPTVFPGDHTGFVEHPEIFAATFRNTLSATGSGVVR